MQITAAPILEFNPFQVVPDAFIWIQLGRIARKLL
jgi:hypothetical protein